METKTLSKNLKVYDLNFLNANVKIYKDNIQNPIVKCDESFLVSENDTTVKINELSLKRTKNLELVLPNNSNNEEIIFSSVIGNINLKNLILNRLIISHVNGNINLEDVDSLFTDIKLIHGDIIAEINNSIFNYTTRTLGNCEQSTIEMMDTNNILSFSKNKHHLSVSNKEGNIKILFKGKR